MEIAPPNTDRICVTSASRTNTQGLLSISAEPSFSSLSTALLYETSAKKLLPPDF
jgi:hypothetical protein